MNLEEISNKVKTFSKNTVEEVQKMNEIRQLNSKANETKKQIAGLYSEIGKKLYNLYRDSPLEGFESEIQTIHEKHELILDIRNRIRGVKGVTLCPCCGMEVSMGERFCSNCGTKMPEIAEIVDKEEAAETIESVDVTGQTEAAEKAAENARKEETPETDGVAEAEEIPPEADGAAEAEEIPPEADGAADAEEMAPETDGAAAAEEGIEG